jgi:glycosyltransferase involved in cell wall biosynthesis/SAM-dependent methyltransferase
VSRVSVIIPCFNDGAYIDEAVDSVLAQSYQDFEIVIVNDGSTDPRTNVILSNYSRPKTRVIETVNQGVARARNRAIEEASGEFILSLDADDKIGTEYLKEAVKVLDEDPDVGIVYCLAEFFGDKKGLWELPPYSLEGMLLDNLIFNAAFFRKNDWEAVNGFNPDMKDCYEDWDFWLSLVELGRKVYRIPNVSFYYRITEGSRMRSATEEQMVDTRVQVFRSHEDLYMNNIRVNPRPFVAGLTRDKRLIEGILDSKTWRWTRPMRTVASFFYGGTENGAVPVNVIQRWFPSLKSDVARGQASCPHCRNTSPLYLQTKDLNRKISKEVFTYYRCPSCGLIFLFPVPENLNDYYPREYYFAPPSYTAQPTIEQLKVLAEADRYKIELVQRFATTGRLLEIGSSWGAFSYLAKEAGFETEVVEMDSACCRFLEEVVGLKTINDPDIPRALQHVAPYQVVALWHVLEHIPDPWAALRAISRALTPGGVLIISTPNPDSLQFRIFGPYWFHLDAPRHLELIPSALLGHEMDRLGFERLLLTHVDKGSLALNSPGWGTSMISLFSRSPLGAQAEKIGNQIGRMISRVERRDRLGSAYTMVFRKVHQQATEGG